MRTFFYVVDMALELYIWFLLAVAVLSWLIGFKVIDGRNPIIARVGRLLATITDPALRPVRGILPATEKVDISPVVAITIIIMMRYALAIYVVRPMT